ncbi:transposase IS204/IS1001/IS1096/IS1165 family protein, partial [mine drainage metagenome]
MAWLSSYSTVPQPADGPALFGSWAKRPGERSERLWTDEGNPVLGGGTTRTLLRYDSGSQQTNGSQWLLRRSFEAALGISSPWFIAGMNFEPNQRKLHIRVDFEVGSRFAVPGQSGVHAVHDRVTT